VGLEQGPLSLVSTIEELLERKNSGSGLENRDYGRRDSSRWPSGTLYPQKLSLTSPTSGGRSVGTVRLRTKASEFFFNTIRRSCQLLLLLALIILADSKPSPVIQTSEWPFRRILRCHADIMCDVREGGREEKGTRNSRGNWIRGRNWQSSLFRWDGVCPELRVTHPPSPYSYSCLPFALQLCPVRGPRVLVHIFQSLDRFCTSESSACFAYSYFSSLNLSIYPAALWSWVKLASNRNEKQ
jgi:hypothetical protein